MQKMPEALESADRVRARNWEFQHFSPSVIMPGVTFVQKSSYLVRLEAAAVKNRT